jgi:hypothetical protein
VKNFLQNADSMPQIRPTLEIESAKSRQKRHADAMKQLERFGIKVQKMEQR